MTDYDAQPDKPYPSLGRRPPIPAWWNDEWKPSDRERELGKAHARRILEELRSRAERGEAG